jgi:hypothetical protein
LRLLPRTNAYLYERLLTERDRVVTALCDEIEYLRAQLAFRGTHVPGAPLNMSQLPTLGEGVTPRMAVKQHVSDEELDVESMLDGGTIDKTQVAEVLEALGLAPEFDLDNIDFSAQP